MQIYSLNGALTNPAKGRVASLLDRSYKKHIDDVLADGGTIPGDRYLTREYFQFLLRRNPAEIALGIHPDATGIKIGNAPGQVSKLYSVTRDGDLIQTVGGSQPVVHEWRGENYWFSAAATNNNIRTPHTGSISISGDLEVVFRTDIIDINPTTRYDLFGKYVASSGQRTWAVNVSNNRLELMYSLNGETGITGDASIGTITPGLKWYKIQRVASTGVISYFESPDKENWTAIGAPRPGTPGNIWTSTDTGFYAGGKIWNTNQFKLHNIELKSTIDGPIVLNFDANDYRKTDPTNQTSWVASQTGETWTINTDANATGYKGVLVDRTMFQTDGTDDNLKTGIMALNQPVSMYLPVNVFNAAAGTRRLYDGAVNFCALDFTSATSVRQGAGADLNYSTYSPSHYKKTVLFSAMHNGADSSLNLNGQQLVAGDNGSGAPNGFTIGGNRSGAANFINALFSTIIATRTADTPGQQADANAFINQLNKRLY